MVEALVGCDYPSFVPIGSRVIAFPTFFNMAEIFVKIDHVTVIEVLICCGVPNFIKIASRVWPPDARNC